MESTLQAARQIQCLVLKCVYIYRGDQVQTRIVNLYVVIVRGLGYGRADIIIQVLHVKGRTSDMHVSDVLVHPNGSLFFKVDALRAA